MRGWTPAHHAAYHGQLRTLLVGYLKSYVSCCHDNGFTDFDHDTVPYNMYERMYGYLKWQMYTVIFMCLVLYVCKYVLSFLYLSLSIIRKYFYTYTHYN